MKYQEIINNKRPENEPKIHKGDETSTRTHWLDVDVIDFFSVAGTRLHDAISS